MKLKYYDKDFFTLKIVIIIFWILLCMFLLFSYGDLKNIETAKTFLSRVIFLFLMGCLSFAILISYSNFNKVCKKLSWIIIGFCYLSILGIICNPYKKLNYINIDSPLRQISMEKDEKIIGLLKFKDLDKDFLYYLKAALDGKYNLFVRHFSVNGLNIKNDFFINNNKLLLAKGNNGFVFSKNNIQDFLISKIIKMQVTATKNTTVWLVEKDLKIMDLTYQSELIYKDINIPLAKNGLIIAFYFETLDKKPIIVFY